MAKNSPHPDSCSQSFEMPRDSGGNANAKASILKNAQMPKGSVGHVAGGSTGHSRGGVVGDNDRSCGRK